MVKLKPNKKKTRPITKEKRKMTPNRYLLALSERDPCNWTSMDFGMCDVAVSIINRVQFNFHRKTGLLRVILCETHPYNGAVSIPFST